MMLGALQSAFRVAKAAWSSLLGHDPDMSHDSEDLDAPPSREGDGYDLIVLPPPAFVQNIEDGQNNRLTRILWDVLMQLPSSAIPFDPFAEDEWPAPLIHKRLKTVLSAKKRSALVSKVRSQLKCALRELATAHGLELPEEARIKAIAPRRSNKQYLPRSTTRGARGTAEPAPADGVTTTTDAGARWAARSRR